MEPNFESRVWQRAMSRGLLSPTQVNDCLKSSESETPTLQLTELLIAQGMLDPTQVATIRGELTLAEPDAPDDVRAAARDPRNLVGRYVLVAELGRGGMGVVHKAWDGDLRRYVALKILSGPHDKEDLARFRREAQSAAGLNHPNIIKVFEVSPSDETPYIALELIEGRTLHGRKLPPRKAVELMIVIARAVDAAHRKGIIHRDLKPSNVMIDASGSPRIMDFGLAKSVESSSQITVSGVVLGTPAYMSPEQAQARVEDVDQRSDLFSLGATLYELLTGQAPFHGKTALQTLTAVVRCDPIRPRKLVPSIPRPLEAVLLTCLQKDRLRRYPSCEAFARDLERFLRGERVTARIPIPRGILVSVGSALIAFAAVMLFVLWPSAAPPAPAPPIAAKPIDRTDLDKGLRLLEEARLDLYRSGILMTTIHDKLREAERRFDAALEADPASGAAFLGRGDARARLWKIEEALLDYHEAVRRLPTSPAVYISRGRLILDRYIRERTLTPKNEVPEEARRWRESARADLLKARDLSPAQNDLLYLQAWLALADENAEDAIRIAASAIPTATRPEEFHKIRGDAGLIVAQGTTDPAERARLWENCVADYGAAIRLRANYPEAHRERGAAYWHMGRNEEARRDFETALAMNPRDSGALSDLGTFYLRTRQNARAMEYYVRALALDDRNIRALSNRATIYMQEGRFPEARRDLEKALEVNPQHLPALYNITVTLHRLGEGEKALPYVNDIVRRAPAFQRARYYRGVIHYEAKRWKEALADFEQVKDVEPSEAAAYRQAVDHCRRELAR